MQELALYADGTPEAGLYRDACTWSRHAASLEVKHQHQFADARQGYVNCTNYLTPLLTRTAEGPARAALDSNMRHVAARTTTQQ